MRRWPSWSTRVQSGGEECPDTSQVASFPDVLQLGPLGTLRKASLHLLGRLPTAAEIQSILDGGEAALGPAITGLFADPAFSVRLKEMFNDMLLTDRYMGYNGYAVDLLNDDGLPVRSGRNLRHLHGRRSARGPTARSPASRSS